MNYTFSGRSSIVVEDADYDYPNDLDLRPGSELHNKLVNEILLRAEVSRQAMQPRFKTWRAIDQKLTFYIPLDKEEQRVIDPSQGGDPRKPVTVVVPMSLATLDILLTYQVAALMNNPIFQYAPVQAMSKEDILKAQLVQHEIDLQVRRFQTALRLHTMWRDAFIYGFGAVGIRWSKVVSKIKKRRALGYVSQIREEFVEQGEEEIVSEELLYEGNELTNIDPYLFMPDPNVPLDRIQDAEFVGWLDRTNIMHLMKAEIDLDGIYFNVKYVKAMHSPQSKYYNPTETGRYDKDGAVPTDSSGVWKTTNSVDTINMYIDLIPKDWELGESERPEKWYFEVAGDEILISAMKVDNSDDVFPVAVDAPQYDGHRLSPISTIETIYGMQTHVDWLFRSHTMNVRKAIHDMFVVDPYLINMPDLATPGPKYIRLRRAAWGRGVENAIKQLAVTDVTRNNMADMAAIFGVAEQATGASEMMKGSVRRVGERVSATEAQNVFSGALSRLEKTARLSAIMSLQVIGMQMAGNTRMFKSAESSIEISDELRELLGSEYADQEFMAIKPADIDIFVDIIPSDGSIPNAASAQTWVQLYQILSTNPVLAQQFDMVRIFKHIATTLGAKDINHFVAGGGDINPQVMPDEEIQAQTQQGNLVPEREL